MRDRIRRIRRILRHTGGNLPRMPSTSDVKLLWLPVTLIISLVGLAGIPDDTTTWGRVVRDHAPWMQNTWVITALLGAGLALLSLWWGNVIANFKLRRHAQTQSSLIATDPAGPDMPIGMAVNYLLHQSEWGYDKLQWHPYEELDEALRVGAISSWGQRCLTPLENVDATYATGGPAFTGVTEKLTTEHWEHMKLIPRWIMFSDQPTAHYPHLAWMRDKECKTVYGKLKVNRREIEEKWPPRR